MVSLRSRLSSPTSRTGISLRFFKPGKGVPWRLCFIVLMAILMEKIGFFQAGAISLEENGPRFVEEWVNSLAFSSRVGGKLFCRAHGQPKPQVQWLTKEFFPVTNISSIREVDDEGGLVFGAFDPEKFRADVHSTTYRCRAFNPVGSVISPETHLRAVVDLPYEIENRDVSVLRGNVAILRCSVPQQVKDFVTVTSWVQDETVNIYPNFQTGKYSLLANGDLYVFNVDASDGYKRFACRTSNKLTNEAKISPPSRLIVKESETIEVVKLSVLKQMTVKARAGEDIYLGCAAEAHPTPSYSWHFEREGSLFEVLSSASKSRHPSLAGPLLLSQVKPEDGGGYVCWVNNSISHDAARVQLNIYVPLHVQVSPKAQVIDVGRTATFRCLTSGSPLQFIEWFKDGQRIGSPGTSRYTVSPPDVLTIPFVHPDDAGMFQCFARNDMITSQDSAQLRLGSVVPELVYRFTEQTLQPGPSVSLKCTAIGNPPPQFQWTLDGYLLPESERFLVGQYVTIHDNVISHVNITNAREDDGGLYSCEARNSMGFISHSARLNIYGPPFIRPIPPVKAVAGKHLQIQCPVSGYPIEGIIWERAGATLPVNRRQKVYSNGTLIVEQVQRGDDGIFTCQAKNRQGLTSTRDLHVQVVVAPKIMPFQFMNIFREGMRAAVSCQVIEGDRPFEFTWQFQGKSISPHSHQGLRITFPDEYSSTLVIENLQSSHSGLYTCVAENSAGHENHSAQLTVNVPPKWTLEPRDINVSSGHSISLNCQAEGYPMPSILWKRATGTQPGEYKDLGRLSSNVFPNGTIRFDDVRKTDEGQYLCEARNGVGSGLSKVIFLRVNAPAQFADRDQEISVRVTEKAILQCRARGDLPIEIQWSNKHSKITSQSNHRYIIRHQNLDDGVMSELLVNDVTQELGGIYFCRAGNMFGSDQTSVVLKVQEPPGQPGNIRTVEQLSRSIRLSWSEAFNGNSQLVNYIIQYKFPSETWTEIEVNELTVPAVQTSAKIERLSPSTSYYFRILAQNGMGFSQPSEVIQVTTAEESPEGPPEEIRIEPLSSTKLKIHWAAPEKKYWHGNILGFYLGYRELGPALLSESGSGGEVTTTNVGINAGSSLDMNGFHFRTVEASTDFGGTAILENLNKFTRYAILVQAFNSQGAGPISAPAVGATLQDVPSMAPEAITCLATSSQSLQITWDDPPLESRNGIIQGYKITHHLEDDSHEHSATPDIKLVTTKSTTFHGLKRWTNYSISIKAFTTAGDGVISKILICQTDEDVPGVMTNVKAVVSSRRSILISWLPPEKPNGKIEKFTVYTRFLDGTRVESKNLQPHERSYTAASLKESQQYEFWVSASTRIGEGGPTPKVRISTSSKVPAKIASFSQKLEVAWKRDVALFCESVGIPEPSISWKFNGDAVELSSRKHVNGIGTLRILEVNIGDAGNYSCQTQNLHGIDLISYQVKVLIPPPPPVLHIIETFYDSVQLSWTTVHNGGAPIKGFLIHYKRGDGDWEEYEAGGLTNSHVLTQLTCGSKYQLYITAANKIGTGLPSQITIAETKGISPSLPKKSDILRGNSSSITISWIGWTELDCPIIRYSVEYRDTSTSDSNWIRVPTDFNGDAKTHSIMGLHSGTRYNIRLTAENHAGKTTANFDFTTMSYFNGVRLNGSPDLEMAEEQESSMLSTSLFIVFPSILALFAVTGAIMFLCYVKRKQLGYGPKTVIGDSPSDLHTYTENQMPNARNQEPRYCPVKTSEPSLCDEARRYKGEPEYMEDICPYATFQLPDKAPGRPMLTKGDSRLKYGHGHHTGDTLYSVGNIYSGPYHSVQSPGFLYNQAPTMQMREPEYMKIRRRGREFQSEESENMANLTDAEVKKILALHMPITEYDTLGSDSEGEKYHQNASPAHQHSTRAHPNNQNQNQNSNNCSTLKKQHEMVTFRQRERSDPTSTITSENESTSTDSSPIGGGRKSSYFSRKSKSKSSVQSGGSSVKQRVRSSSGYSSHTEETSFRIQPPTRFSDSRELSDAAPNEFGLAEEEFSDPKSAFGVNSSSGDFLKGSNEKSRCSSTIPTIAQGIPRKSSARDATTAYHIDV